MSTFWIIYIVSVIMSYLMIRLFIIHHEFDSDDLQEDGTGCLLLVCVVIPILNSLAVVAFLIAWFMATDGPANAAYKFFTFASKKKKKNNLY